MSIPAAYQDIPLPNFWPKYIKSAMICVVSLAHVAMTYSRGWAANSMIRRVQLSAELDEVRNTVPFQILVSFLEGRRHLPIVELRQAA